RRDLVPRRGDREERRDEPVVDREGADDDAEEGGSQADEPRHGDDHQEKWRRGQRLDQEAERDEHRHGRDRGRDAEEVPADPMRTDTVEAHRIVSVTPPSTTSVWPVIQRASALARSTARALA